MDAHCMICFGEPVLDYSLSNDEKYAKLNKLSFYTYISAVIIECLHAGQGG